MDVRSLTQTEAEERAALLSVERYDVAVDLTALPTGPEVRCTSTVTFTARRPGASTFVDCAARVLTATLNGAPLGAPDGGRLALPDLRDHNVLVVESVQDETATGAGVHKATDPADGEVYLWTSFEPDEARFVWACFDQPDLKAPHAFTVTAPGGWTVLSNSGEAEVEELADGTRRWSFAATPPLSTYNPVVLGGPFAELRREAGGYDLGLYVRRSMRSVLEREAEEVFTVTEQGLGFYGEAFGMPFPQRRYDQVFLPEFGGAMENYGCVAWSDAFLTWAPPTHAERELLALVLLHEMAHMWFGNVVTMRWWDDLWLNEAFAEFACHWAAVRATAYTDVWTAHLAGDELDAYLADQGPASHPIRQPVRDVAEAASTFDAITYPKGASVLRQLMTYVGEEEFTAGMRAYFAEHAWGTTTLEDLVEALARASGRDLAAWQRGWLETAGTDRLTLERDGEALVLVAEGPEGPPRPHVLEVGAYRRAGSALERTASARVEVAGARTPVGLAPGADLYLVNDEDLTFATTRPDPASRDALFTDAALLPTPISRGVAVATVWDLLVNGEATAVETVPALLGVLRVETSGSAVEPYLRLATEAATLWAPTAEVGRLSGLVAACCRELADDPAGDHGRRRVALRGFARTAPDPEAVAWLRTAAGEEVDLHWRALVRLAELGGETGRDVDELLARDPDPEAWVRGLEVRAATPRVEEKAAVWQAVVEERSVPVALVGRVAAAFWRADQAALTAPYADRYLGLLPTLDRGGMIPAMVYTRRLFPLFGIDEGYLSRAEEAAAAAAPVVRKSLVERADEVRRMLVARSA